MIHEHVLQLYMLLKLCKNKIKVSYDMLVSCDPSLSAKKVRSVHSSVWCGGCTYNLLIPPGHDVGLCYCLPDRQQINSFNAIPSIYANNCIMFQKKKKVEGIFL